jgi:hypothetical protein
MPSEADRMVLLTNLEEAREKRRTAEFRAATRVHAGAAAAAQDAARKHLAARHQRQVALSQSYAEIIGSRPINDVQALRTAEQILAQRQSAAGAAQQQADAAEQQASAACELARAALQIASQRKSRRSRIADLLKAQESRAAMTAEEQSVADELIDRFRGEASG